MTKIRQNNHDFEKIFIFDNKIIKLTLRRPLGKVTPRRPLRRARRFQWRHALRALKLKPTFLQVLKTIYWLLNSKFMSEIAKNWLISSQFFGQEKCFMVPVRLWVCALTTPAWLINDELISSLQFLINHLQQNQPKLS